MNTVSLSVPSQAQSSDQQLQTTQQALTQLNQTVNQNATTSLCDVYQQSPGPLSSGSNSGAAAQIPGATWAFTSSGGLVIIQGVIAVQVSSGGAGALSLVIDGKTVLTLPVKDTSAVPVFWASILAAQAHSVQMQYSASSGTLSVNPSGYSSSVAIFELPENVNPVGGA
jgi:hypothetical protein